MDAPQLEAVILIYALQGRKLPQLMLPARKPPARCRDSLLRLE